MKTIKASEILESNTFLTPAILEHYKFYAVDRSGFVGIYRQKPDEGEKSWIPTSHYLCAYHGFKRTVNWKESLREIDHENNS